MTFYQILWTFFLFTASPAGAAEVVFRRLQKRKFVNRGFFWRPVAHIRICVTAAVLLIAPSKRIGCRSLFIATLVPTIIEWLAGRQAVARPPWDYSGMPLNQRICVPAVFLDGQVACLSSRGFPWSFACWLWVSTIPGWILLFLLQLPSDRFRSHRPGGGEDSQAPASIISTSWSAACASIRQQFVGTYPGFWDKRAGKSCGPRGVLELPGSRKRNSWLSRTKFWKSTTPCWNARTATHLLKAFLPASAANGKCISV